jgi:hypothetical protein
MINLPMLQRILPSIKTGNTSESWVVLVVIAGIIVILIITSRFSGGGASGAKGGPDNPFSEKPRGWD